MCDLELLSIEDGGMWLMETHLDTSDMSVYMNNKN